MRKKLNERDIKDLRSQCRIGYVIPFMIFILGTFISGAIYELNFNLKSDGLNTKIILLIALGFIIISFFVSYKMNWKYLLDIRNNEKEIELKTIQKKEYKRDYEAGSGSLGQEMNGYDSFSIVVENYRYRVDKDIFINSNEGDEVFFYYAPISEYLINIELKKMTEL